MVKICVNVNIPRICSRRNSIIFYDENPPKALISHHRLLERILSATARASIQRRNSVCSPSNLNLES